MSPETYRSLLSSNHVAAPSEGEQLSILGDFINHATDEGDRVGARHAIKLARKLRDSSVLKDETLTHLHYFEANAWSLLKPDPSPQSAFAWTWQDEATENEVRQLRLARRSPGFSKVHTYTQAQIHTNLGNALSTLGRFVEAIECFDKAKAVYPAHGMARGNRGICLCTYAQTLPHLVHAPGFCSTTKFYQESQQELTLALNLPAEGDAHEGFLKYLGYVTEMLESSDSADGFAQPEDLNRMPLPEPLYWSWCLKNRLVLNQLNDILMNSKATGDVLHLPPFTANSQTAQLLFGLLNQMKIEFVTARLLLFEGSTATEEHFADAGIQVADTRDFTALSINVEKMRAAYRSTYSIFDKIAFFMNYYLDLDIPARDVAFRRIWLATKKKSKKLSADFETRPNWPLRGLYWLSKDLQADKTDDNAIDPDAKDLSRIRNHIEHCHLKIHDDAWIASKRGSGGEATDGSYYAMDREDFILRALRLLKLARSALTYLVFSIYADEQIKAGGVKQDG